MPDLPDDGGNDYSLVAYQIACPVCGLSAKLPVNSIVSANGASVWYYVVCPDKHTSESYVRYVA